MPRDREGRPGPTSGRGDYAGDAAVKFSLSIDRFEGDEKEIAVLLDEDGTQINFPRRLLPRDASAGDVLALSIARDTAATRRVADRTRKVQGDLKKTDPGGDITL